MIDEKKTLNGLTLELHKNSKGLQLHGMVKIQDEEIWATIPIDSREEFDYIPKDIVKAIVMDCARSYFYSHVCGKENRHELERMELTGDDKNGGEIII